MKDDLKKWIESGTGVLQKKNMIREYLQAYILRSLYNRGFFEHCTFHGGTCLRFVYDIKRFSEDLDFVLLQNKTAFDFDRMILGLEQDLTDAAYTVEVKKKEATVLSALIKFPGLLFELKLSQRKTEIISIKIEIDTNPPRGGMTRSHIVNKHFMIGLSCYDMPTLFAGKMNAILTRKYTKGRDYYDLFWYLAGHKELMPNFNFLKNALSQFDWKGEYPNEATWREKLIDVISTAEWNIVQKDVELLLEDSNELRLFSKQNLLNLLAV